MNLPLAQKPLTPTAFLEWEDAQTDRHIYYDGEVFAMAGAGEAHNLVAGNLFVLLKTQLKGRSCRVFMADMRLAMADDRHFTYPDIFVTCDARDREPSTNLTKRHPSFICEVLSASTADYDLGLKFEGYCAIDSVQEVLFIHPERRTVTLYTRGAPPDWLRHPVALGETLRLASIAASFEVNALFEDVDGPN